MKLLKKYYNLSAPAKASMWFLACSFLQKAIATITTPIFTRLFTTEQFGVYSVYQSWYSIVSIIAGLSLTGGVYTKGLIKHEDDQDRFSSSMLGLSITSTLICMVIYYIASPVVNKVMDMSTLLVTAMFMATFLTNAYGFWSHRERVYYRYKKLVALTVARTVAGPLLGVFAVITAKDSFKVEARVISVIVTELIFFAWVYFYLFKKGKVFYHKEYWKYALAFNLPLIPHYLSKVIFSNSDKIMISSIIGDDAAGLYSLAASLAHIIIIFKVSIFSTMEPWIFRNMKEKKYKEISRVGNIIFILIAALNLMVIAFGPEIIAIMAPKTYAPAAWVIPPTAAGVYLMAVYSAFTTIEFHFEKTKFIMVASMSCAVVNVILNYVFLMLFKDHALGFVAAAYTTFVCYVLLSVAHYLAMKRMLKIHLGGQRVYNAKTIILISVAFFLITAAITALYPFPIVRYIFVAVMLVVAFVFRNKIIAVFKQMKKKKVTEEE